MGIKSSSKSFSKDQVRYNPKAGIALTNTCPTGECCCLTLTSYGSPEKEVNSGPDINSHRKKLRLRRQSLDRVGKSHIGLGFGFFSVFSALKTWEGLGFAVMWIDS